jgi:DNA-binding winged helix-turn-helix (wHTH) protein
VTLLFAFEDFELDEARFELRRAGRRVAVQPKALKLLLYWVAHRHRSVPVTELLQALWPGLLTRLVEHGLPGVGFGELEQPISRNASLPFS